MIIDNRNIEAPAKCNCDLHFRLVDMYPELKGKVDDNCLPVACHRSYCNLWVLAWWYNYLYGLQSS